MELKEQLASRLDKNLNEITEAVAEHLVNTKFRSAIDDCEVQFNLNLERLYDIIKELKGKELSNTSLMEVQKRVVKSLREKGLEIVMVAYDEEDLETHETVYPLIMFLDR